MTQNEPTAKQIDTYHSITGKYKRDEVKPTIDVAKRLVNVLETTVGYLLVETEKVDLFKGPVMLQRLVKLDKMESTEKSHILHVLDGFIKSVKLKNIAAL
ncbi:XRE family transcriptional regulator [Weeksellaceae bacterium KMM 9713]|uniref:XRE family transcriptional regulator n=1 Tax=Profundicola chukchiensis TaxID=2961959 RepID=A0A9X4MYC6_9FLAO|nr:XRE family transcriptional regulator [Profundicola chukchiensis]MDG4945062.1 XRE family transcriptional regulator [Profundicola chukchiensis]MDG4950146.1 XRE family transcriptional regulator [Profundicola chukchiensis]